MAASNLQVKLSKETEKQLLVYASAAQQLLINQFSIRTVLTGIDMAYMRENNWTEAELRARLANNRGDAHKMQDVTVPIVMPQVRSALGYMNNTFLTGNPIFGVVSDPANEDAALQMEAIIGENSVSDGWARQMMIFFQDGLKYNLHALECEWQQKTVYNIGNDLAAPNGAKSKKVIWNGNSIKRMDLYNTFFDPRVHPSDIYRYGEYAGYIDVMPRMRMKEFINSLYGTVPADVAIRAFESAPAAGTAANSMSPWSWYMPIINPMPIMWRDNLQTFDWLAWATDATLPGVGKNNNNARSIRYGNVYFITKLYCRIIPADFGMDVPEKNTPQVWKLIIVNGQVVLFAERQTNAHNHIPIYFGQPLEDGLDYQTKSFATNVTDMQSIATAMWSGYMASKRRLVGDRVLYDPMRIREKDINSTNPAAKIPVRPTAYGQDISKAVYQFPFHDEQTNSLIQGASMVVNFANLINGQNPAAQGQFVKGNKTKHEYQDVMGHGNDNNQAMALMTESQVFVPMKECIKLNILQYQKADTIYSTSTKQLVKVDPVALREAAVVFKISDGLLPSDKLMDADAWQSALQVIGTSAAIGGAYNVAPMFSYLMKQQGADLTPFEKSPLQVQFEQQTQAWQQVAEIAIKNGQPIPPQPVMPPALQQLLQQGPPPSASTTALQATQQAPGSGPAGSPTTPNNGSQTAPQAAQPNQ